MREDIDFQALEDWLNENKKSKQRKIETKKRDD